jgi:hypothetical protein
VGETQKHKAFTARRVEALTPWRPERRSPCGHWAVARVSTGVPRRARRGCLREAGSRNGLRSAGFTEPGGAMNLRLGAGLTAAWMLAFAVRGGLRGRVQNPAA